jgi:uncharacterized protein (TIGR03086 family)
VSLPQEWAAPGAPALDGAALLERSVGYTRGAVQLVASTPLTAPTPCRGWDLLALLRHMNDGLAALTDAAEIGYVDLLPVEGSDPGAELVERLRSRACALLAAWAHHPGVRRVAVADRALRSDVLAAAGSLEVAVHGWDLAQACGVDRPIPARLAFDLLEVVPLVVGEADRPARFAEPVDVPLGSGPGTRLLAVLGRSA